VYTYRLHIHGSASTEATEIDFSATSDSIAIRHAEGAREGACADLSCGGREVMVFPLAALPQAQPVGRMIKGKPATGGRRA
jgi:hypothetical protein